MCAKITNCLVFISSVMFVFAADPPGGYYTTRYDHIDVENILNQKRLVYYYAECLLDRGPCTPQGIEFKRILPEALRTNCLRCTEKQRFVTMKSIRRLKKEYPDVWGQLSEIWDPTGEYFKRLEDSVNKKYNRSPEVLPLSNRIGSTNQEIADTEKVANTVANKPISFSTTTTTTTEKVTTVTSRKEATTTKITPTTTQTKPTTTQNKPTTTQTKPKITTTTTTTTTPKPTTTVKASTTPKPIVVTKRVVGVSYNYDFAVTTKPVRQQPVGGLNIVLRGVNNIIAPITDIAGKVITAGTDFAGMVLNVLGVRRTY